MAASRILDDLVRAAAGAANTAAGMGEEMRAQMRENVERLAARADLVTRDEFEAVKEMAANARTEQERLAEKLAALEARLDDLAARKPASPAKPRARASAGGRKASKPETKPE